MIKTLTIDGFYSSEEAQRLRGVVIDIPFVEIEFGLEIKDFNMVPGDADELFSRAVNKPVKVIDEKSGVFRIPKLFIHFEEVETPNDWLFVVALDHSTFNLFEHKTGVVNALQEHKFNYRNLFEWDLTVNYLLKPGQGIFFRPWLFHSFDQGLIQTFRLQEKT